MAKINFRHGIVSRQQDTPTQPSNLRLSGQYVDLIVSPTPTLFTIAHFDEDYLLVENQTILHAWGPIPSQDCWIYWDIDHQTGEITRGITIEEPIVQVKAPTGVIPQDLHWFDMANKVMKVRKGVLWEERLRVFAAKIIGGGILQYMPIGSQIGTSSVSTYAGFILFDPEGKPVKKFRRDMKGQFFTTETPLKTQFIRTANFRIEASVTQAQAVEPIAVHYAVAFDGYNRIRIAKHTVPNYPAVGLAAESLINDQVGSFITQGYVQSEDFDWAAYPAGTPLFVGDIGQLTPVIPQLWSVQQIAVIVDPETILVDIQPIILYQ